MAITGGSVAHRFRVHDGDPATLAAFRAGTGGAALVVTSIRGDALPYLVGAPKGDGAKIDVFTGKVKAATYTGQLADAVTATSPSVLRVFSSQLEDANGQQQLGNRYAAFDFRLNGGAWTTLTLGLLARYTLSSEIVWDVTINDPTQAENGHMAFAPQQDPATGQLETIAAYLARWPNRGCILGGPIRGGFGPQTDRGGWEMRVQSLAGATTSLQFVAGYAAPLFKRTTNIQDCATDANAKTDSLYGHPDWGVAPKAVTFDDANMSQWRGVVIEILGVGFYLPSFGLYSGDTFNTDGQLESHLVKTIRRRGIYIWSDTYPATGAASGLPADGTAVRVRALTAQVSDISPIYWNGHPVDLLAKLWDEAGIAYDSAAIETTRAALGSNLGIALRITAPQEMGAFLEQTIYGPFGVGVAVNDAGLLAPFASRVFSNTPPTRTITNDDVARGTTKPFDLDVTTAIRKVTFAHTKLLLPKTTYDPSTIDGFIVQPESFEWTNNEPGALGTQEVNYTVPGMVYTINPITHQSNDAALNGYSYAIALDVFSRTGRGMRQGATKAIRGGNADGLKLGDECLVALKQLPNHNRRLGDDNTVTARAMQVIQMTPSASGYDITFADSGPNAQPFATLPVITLAASSDAPRTTALLTITNAATLNAAPAGVRVQMATTTGAAPSSGDYTDALAYAAGNIPTTAIRLPAVVAGSTLWARARSEQPPTARPSNYCTPAHLALSAIPDPTALTATPVAADSSQCALAWTPGTTETGILTDVFVRLASESASSNVRRVALMPGSGQYTLEGLIGGQAYIASVQHRDGVTGNTSDLVTVTFTQIGALVTLDAPTDANGFSGSQDPQYGFPQKDGVYGLAVAATEFPGFTEFVEQVETAPNAGTYGEPVSVAIVPNVQGNWTIYENVAPNDGLRRILAARHVRDGANDSAYTAGVVVTPWTAQPLGLFSQTAGTGGIIRVSPTKSSDGLSEIFALIVGAKVDAVHVHYRTVPIDATGDVYDFSGDEDVSEDPSLMIKRPVAQAVSFSIPLPLRNTKVAGRMVSFVGTKDGPSVPFTVDAAPPVINAPIKVSRNGITADLTIPVAFGPSDGPVQLQVYERLGTVETLLLTKPIAAPTTIDKTSDPVLGGRALPIGKDSLVWRDVITDVAGEAWNSGDALGNRDPLPNGSVTLGNNRANPTFVIAFDPDTDSVIYTAHSGKTKTWNRAALDAAGSPVTYELGVTPLDDLSIETALVVDETRSGAHIDFVGGGTTVANVWSGDLHGQPKNPPTIKVDVEPVGDGDTVNVFGTPDTQVDEQLYVHYRLGITAAALEYVMCVGAGDPTPLAVTAGTQIGPSNFFRRVDGVGSPTALLAGIDLTHDQITVHQMQAIGVQSGMPSSWTNVQLSLLPLPLIESLALKFDPAAPNLLSATINAGARCGSAGVEFADNEMFSAPLTASGNVTDGNQLVLSVTLSDAQLGKQWHARVTPFSLASMGGLVGKQSTAACAVPAVLGDPQVSVSENAATKQTTITISIDDKGSYLATTWTDGTATGALHAMLLALGVSTEHSMTTHTLVGTVHTWTLVVAQDPLHVTGVKIFVHFIDGSVGLLLDTSVDTNKVSDVANATVANNGVTATVTADWDTDTLIGSNCARYSLDGGSTWTTGTVSSVWQSQFAITRTSVKQTAILQAKNAIDGNWGDQSTVEIDAYLSEGPSFDVHVVEGTTTTQVFWSCSSGTALLSIDGGTPATPSASPITVTRPAALAKKKNYSFAFTIGGQTITDAVDVLPVDSDTVTPNLSVPPGTLAATTESYTPTVGNPQSGGATPTLTVTCTGCTMTISGTTYPDGTTQTIASSTTVQANKPVSTSTTTAKLTFVATLAGATESIVIQIQPQLAVGPSLDAHYERLTSSTGQVVWHCTVGVVSLKIDTGTPSTPSASPIAITLDANPHSYMFTAVVDGQTISAPVSIPALATATAFGTFSGLSATPDYVANTVTFAWTCSIIPDNFYVRITEVNALHGTTPSLNTVSGAATSFVYTPTVTIVNSHTSSQTRISCDIEPIVAGAVGPSSLDITDTEFY